MTGASVSLPVAGSAVVTGIGALAFLLVLYRIIDPPGGDGVGREVGVWLGLIATAGITYGGYVGMQEEGTSFTDVRDQVTPPR
jgi:formate hydrogenlyase subunit 3/multisubunit Na+/H+ antiporter MnhD subunit